MLRPIDQFIVDGFRDDPESMAVMEQLVQNYFDKYMAAEIDRVHSDLYRQQAEYLRRSTGFLDAMASGSNPAYFDDPLNREILQGNNKDLFKSPEDMVLFCKRQLRMNDGMREDMTLMTEAWRHSALILIGRQEYDKISKRLGQDLAVQYMDYRLSELILKKMVQEQAPTSTVDYVFRKACEGSLFGLAQTINKTPMQMRIDQEGEQRLSVSQGAKTTAKALSFAMDAPMTGALTCWGSLIGVGALEVGLEMAQPVLISQIQGQRKSRTVEEILSRSMFHSEDDEFAKMRSQSLDYISQTNVLNTLQPKMHNSPDLFNHPIGSDMLSGKSNGALGLESRESVFTSSPYASASTESVFNMNQSLAGNPASSENASSARTSIDSKGTDSKSRPSSSASTKLKAKPASGNLVSSSTSTSTSASTVTSSSKTTHLSDSSNPSTNPLSDSSNPSTLPTSSSTDARNTGKTAHTEGLGKDGPKPESNADKNTNATAKSTHVDGGYALNEVNATENQDQYQNQHQNQNQSERGTAQTSSTVANANNSTPHQSPSEDEDRTMASQWAPLIGQFGLNDLKGVGTNLGLILATLPDMLFGIFSKNDDNPGFSWSKNLIPIASLLLGFKFRNPVLKMLLVGFGGVGLIKNGMDNIVSNDLNNAQTQSASATSSTSQSNSGQQVRFVPYAQEPLNPRIENLHINNNILVMDIDKVPYTVTLPEPVALAYQSQSLPLTTLANAVLQKYDQAVSAMQQSDLNQGIHRYNRGVDMLPTEQETVTLK